MGFMHIYMKYTQPLFIQALMGIKALAEAKPVAIHVFGKKAEGDLKRPFKAGGLFGGPFILLLAALYLSHDYFCSCWRALYRQSINQGS